MAMDLAGQDKQSDARSRATAIAWGIVILAAILAYWPGLQGPFVLDDFKSLRDLGNLSGVTDWDSFMVFVFGGTAGPTGRPLALASFLIDGNNWPTDPWPFKRTNLVIHLLNGVLLGVLTQQILRLLDFDRERAARLALVSAAAWLLHPFLVSTTLYAVQRMTQLAMLFSIVGMITYLYGRSLLGTNKTKAYLVMTVSLVSSLFLRRCPRRMVLCCRYSLASSRSQFSQAGPTASPGWIVAGRSCSWEFRRCSLSDFSVMHSSVSIFSRRKDSVTSASMSDF